MAIDFFIMLFDFFRTYPVNIIFRIFLIIFISLFLNLIIKLSGRRFMKIAINKKPLNEKRIIETRYRILIVMFSLLLYLVAIILILFSVPVLKSFSLSLAAGAGILAIIIGFAAQKTLSNIISGISIAIYAPFRIGDRVKISNENGIVEDINLRQVIIRTWDNKRIIIPNSLISEQEVHNYSIIDEKMLFALDIGIDHNSNIDKAKEIMVNLARKHEENLIFREKDEEGEIIVKEPYVRVVSLGDFSIGLRLYFWVSDNSKGFKMKYELLEQIKKEFDKNRIEIPFPHRTIVFKDKDFIKKK